jgi:MoxR-like ATPase
LSYVRDEEDHCPAHVPARRGCRHRVAAARLHGARIRGNGAGGAAPARVRLRRQRHLLRSRQLLETVYLDDKVKSYVVDLVFATRDPAQVGLGKLAPLLLYGASPRASLALTRAARARAFLDGRGFVTPQDVKAVGMAVLRHRVIITYEAEAEELTSEHLLQQIFDHVPVP